MEEKSNIEIINLLNELEEDIKRKINLYNYYIDVIIDRFPNLENSIQFKKIDIMEVQNEREEDNKIRRV